MICEKNKCCGCGSCAAICPEHCINMYEDEEGFIYPHLDDKRCMNCGLCIQACPILNNIQEVSFEQSAYIVQNKNEEICFESTSGGFFTALASEMINRNGVVYGAAYDEEFRVKHQRVEMVSELKKFRNSKYVQSDLRDIFGDVKEYLEQKEWVCFSGTPCQIEGIKRYLGKEYDNLILVDVVCRAVPSPMVWKKYIDMIQNKIGVPIKNIRFRDKKYGYKYSTMNFENIEGETVYSMGVESDVMHRAFFSNICDRPSCYQCQFKKRYRESDFTIWDCFQVGRYSKKLDNDKGATRVLIHTDKGKKLFETIKNQLDFINIGSDEIVKGSKEMFCSVSMNRERERFMKDAAVLNGEELFDKYFPNTFRVALERNVRRICLKMGIYSAVKKTVVRIIGKY